MSIAESISNNQSLKSIVNLFEQVQDQVENEEKKGQEQIDSCLNDYEESLNNTSEIDAYSNTTDSEDDAEIYNDTIHKLENGTNATKNDLISAIRSFRNFKLPKFSKEHIQRVRAPLLFQGTYISKTACDKLNKELKWGISWRAGFLVADNAEVIAIKFSPKKNKDKYHLNQIEKWLKAFGRKSGLRRKYHFGKWQILNGYACKPIYPDIEDIIPSGKFSFIGKLR